MLFQSFNFLLVFLPITWALYMCLRFTFLRPVLLTVSGYIFYAWGQPWFACVLFASSTVDFLVGLYLSDTENALRRKWLLAASLIFNLGLLSVFKYSGWALTTFNELMACFHIRYHLRVLEIGLPPGISFYTFQSLAYIIDIYRGKIKAHRKIIDYWSFVAFFPQLFAGPIERAGHLLPQLTHPRRFIHPRMIESGLFMIAWGLFKKLFIADNMGNLAELCKNNMALSGAGVMLALSFSFEIYADFSGYTDIARGCAKLFGIKLRRNFLTPYFSRSPSEFWQRWHISLSSWIRDYLYQSLGGNRAGTKRTLQNLFITMCLAGLWHGAGMFFVLWGIYHALLLILYRVLPMDAWLSAHFARSGRTVAMLLMFSFTAFGWVLFYLGLHGDIRGMIFPDNPEQPALQIINIIYGFIFFGWPLALSDILAYRRHREFTDLWGHFRLPLKVLLLLCMFYAIVFFGARDAREFIYFQF